MFSQIFDILSHKIKIKHTNSSFFVHKSKICNDPIVLKHDTLQVLCYLVQETDEKKSLSSTTHTSNVVNTKAVKPVKTVKSLDKHTGNESTTASTINSVSKSQVVPLSHIDTLEKIPSETETMASVTIDTKSESSFNSSKLETASMFSDTNGQNRKSIKSRHDTTRHRIKTVKDTDIKEIKKEYETQSESTSNSTKQIAKGKAKSAEYMLLQKEARR